MAAKSLFVVDRRDIQATIKRLERVNPQAKRILVTEINSTAQDIRKDAVININSKGIVDTGTLKNSAQVKKTASQANLDAEVGVYAKYAPFIEFGTGTFVDVPQGLEEYALQFKGKGIRQVNLPARPFFFPAVFKNRQKFIENVKNALNRLR